MAEDPLTCALCPRTCPVEEAIADGWEPAFYVDQDSPNTGDPVCWECRDTKCHLIRGEDYYTLKIAFRHLMKE